MNVFALKHLSFVIFSGLLWMMYIPTAAALTQNEIQKLLASDAAAGDQFGYSVSFDGDTAVIGALGDDRSGSAYVFIRNGSTWTEQAKLTASDAAIRDQFGVSVSLDGDTAVIGALQTDDADFTSGSAYVFTRNGSTWSEQATFTASDAAAVGSFGFSVSLDGDTAVIGAFDDDDAGDRSGSAYVFTRNGSTWTEQAKLIASDAAALDRFGYSVSLDGGTAVIGAFYDDGAGSAYVFTRNGSTWTEQAKLTASDVAASDRFGFSVSLDGDTAVIGAFYDDDAGDRSGSAYVFIRNGSTWTEQAKLTAIDAAIGDQFGVSVSLDGDTVVIGAFQDDDASPNSGSAYVFTRNGSTWTEQATLTASDAATGDNFGDSVSLDGNTAVIGARAYQADDTSGSAYVFTLTGPDTDEDGIPDDDDNCPNNWNFDQANFDDDDYGDVCDDDDDNDDQTDVDETACGSDPLNAASQSPDNDGDDSPDCVDMDDDNDTVADDTDNCPFDPNPSQADFDGDSIGDVCDDDSDGVADIDDQCLLTGPDAATDATGCSITQHCPVDGRWRNHGNYVRCVVRETRHFLRSGLITRKEQRAIVIEAAQSDIGKKRKYLIR